LLGYGRAINRTLSAGLNLKIDNQSFAGFSASGVGLDVGLSGQRGMAGGNFLRGVKAGFVIKNLIEPSLKLDQDNVPDPMQVVAGVAAVTGFNNVTMETTLDLVQPRFSPFEVQFGQDIRYRDHFSFRFGVNDGAPTLGFGARYKNVALDYAFLNTDLGDNNRFSLAVRFGHSMEQRRTQARAQLEKRLNDEISSRLQDMERQQFETALSAGDSLFEARHFVQARELYESSLMWDPQNDHARVRIGECRYRELIGLAYGAIAAEDYAQGLFHAGQALDLRTDDPTASAAADRCRQQLAASQNAAQLVNNLLSSSIDMYAEGSYADALRGFDEVLSLDNNNVLALQYRDKSRMQLRSAVMDLIERAKKAAADRDYDAAFALLEQALRMDSGNGDIDVAMEDIRAQRDEMRDTPYVPPVTTTTSPANRAELEAKYLQGLSAFNRGQFNAAVQILSDVWLGDPNFDEAAELLTRAHLLLGMRQYSQDRYDLAIQQWRRALDVDPDNTKAKRYIRRAEEEIKRLARVSTR